MSKWFLESWGATKRSPQVKKMYSWKWLCCRKRVKTCILKVKGRPRSMPCLFKTGWSIHSSIPRQCCQKLAREGLSQFPRIDLATCKPSCNPKTKLKRYRNIFILAWIPTSLSPAFQSANKISCGSNTGTKMRWICIESTTWVGAIRGLRRYGGIYDFDQRTENTWSYKVQTSLTQ